MGSRLLGHIYKELTDDWLIRLAPKCSLSTTPNAQEKEEKERKV